MQSRHKLAIIKTLHTAIWLFYNVVIAYMLYAVIIGRLDRLLWIGYMFVIAEGIVLAVFGFTCPLTILARKYSDSSRDNFDIYLPHWLARNTKRIYTGLFMLIIVITLYQLNVKPQ